MPCLKMQFLLPQRNKPMSTHVFNLLQTKEYILLMFWDKLPQTKLQPPKLKHETLQISWIFVNF